MLDGQECVNGDGEGRARHGRSWWIRGVLVATQAATLWVTWPLWQARASPIHVPIWGEVPVFDAGPWLLASLVLFLVRPVWGWAAYVAVLTLAILADGLRLQPQVVAQAGLMLVAFPGAGPLVAARLCLFAHWFYGGLFKLLGAHYLETFGDGVLRSLAPGLPEWARDLVSWSTAGVEVALGVALWLPLHRWPRLRLGICLTAIGLHGSIVAVLARLDHNPGVWAWNIALAAVAPCVLLAPRLRPVRRAVFATWAAAATFAYVVLPAGFPFGWSHPYLSFVLYTGSAPKAYIVRPGSSDGLPFHEIPTIEAKIPPTSLNYQHLFQSDCQPGTKLIILDSRWWIARHGTPRIERFCGAPVE